MHSILEMLVVILGPLVTIGAALGLGRLLAWFFYFTPPPPRRRRDDRRYLGPQKHWPRRPGGFADIRVLCLAALAGTLGLMAFFLVDEWFQPSTAWLRAKLCEFNAILASGSEALMIASATAVLVIIGCLLCYQAGKLHGIWMTNRKWSRSRSAMERRERATL